VALAAEDNPFTDTEFEAYEGGFYYFGDTPNTLYLMGDIGKDTSSRALIALRRAFRNHDITKIVLMSGGGRVDVGLDYAGLIHDNNIAVYVPKEAYCYSACSYMFFGGVERYAEGEVGVHQFYAKTDRQDRVSRAQQATQFGVSDIIAILNSFNVPPKIYEHMFGTIGNDMYILTDSELADLGVQSRQAWHDDVDALMARLAALKPTQEEVVDKTEAPVEVPQTRPDNQEDILKRQANRRLQALLNEHGCEAGIPDGIAGKRTKGAIERFKTSISLKQTPQTEELIAVLENTERPACKPLVVERAPAVIKEKPVERPTPSPTADLSGSWKMNLKCGGIFSRSFAGLLYVSPPKKRLRQSVYYDVSYTLDNNDRFEGKLASDEKLGRTSILLDLQGKKSNRGYEGRIFIKGASLTNGRRKIVDGRNQFSSGPSKKSCSIEAFRR